MAAPGGVGMLDVSTAMSRAKDATGSSVWGEAANKEMTMATQQTVQQVIDYLKAHPDVAKKAADFIKSHPDEVKAALQDVADERGWDLSKIDIGALKAEMGKLPH
jgi:hypothetical protein